MKNKLTKQQMQWTTLEILGLIERCVKTSGVAYLKKFAGPCDLIASLAMSIDDSMTCDMFEKKKSKKKKKAAKK